MRNTFKIGGIGFLCLFLVLLSFDEPQDDDYVARVKVALRQVGHQLLLQSKDSSSLVLPIHKLKTNVFQIQFENHLSIDPDNLVAILESNFKKSGVAESYRVEVLNCSDDEVAYSFEQKPSNYDDIIPCSGRVLSYGCYKIQLRLTDATSSLGNKTFKYLSIGSAVLLLFLGFKENSKIPSTKTEDSLIAIGIFQFYPKENKLVTPHSQVQLSKKEGELLDILSDQINKVVKRDELEKRIWEDQGVIVGRSLDTYISKLRKKFKEDPAIKISNIHGVGYKLEVKN